MRQVDSTIANGEEAVAERVVLVNPLGEQIGTEEKLRAHRLGLMHRAFSVFVVDGRGHVLLQRRAAHKYHSGTLWSNTACGHPRPGENTEAAARRRLREEMGVDCPLELAFDFTYRLPVTPELTEHELDHVFVGRWEGIPRPDSNEVSEWAWRGIDDIDSTVREHPESFSAWFPLIWERVKDRLGGVAR
jgi:isopentenyl-diphosphate Delta-isomerase